MDHDMLEQKIRQKIVEELEADQPEDFCCGCPRDFKRYLAVVRGETKVKEGEL